ESWSLAPLQGRLEDGMKEVVIDISINGTSWQEWGRYTLPKAPGSSFYEGVFGPDFGGKMARHILITGVSNHGGTCFGLGEVRFNGTIATVSDVKDEDPAWQISASPNPFYDQTMITLSGLNSGNVHIVLSDLLGRELKNFKHSLTSTDDQLRIDGSDLASGFYFLSITQNNQVKTIKLEVQK
ncbi:MAG: T9SS type A sorting domain-containing protein, partial [Saprospiraceae bacterium]